MDAPVGDQGLDHLAADAAAWVGDELLEFKLVFGHNNFLKYMGVLQKQLQNPFVGKGLHPVLNKYSGIGVAK